MALPKLLKHLKDLGALSAGDLLKYDGEKVAKAIPGTDYADVELLTWTPYLQVGGATVPAMRYSKQQGWGIRIGKFVHLVANLTLSSKGSMGDAYVSLRGMPYNAITYTAATVGFATGIPRNGELVLEQTAGNYVNMYYANAEGKIANLFFADLSDTTGFEGITFNFRIQ